MTGTATLLTLVDEFFLARRPRKHSPHTINAYRRDILTITEHLAEVTGTPGDQLVVDELTIPVLRRAFAAIDNQAEATIARTWSTWNQLFTFAVAEGHIAGNPMAAVHRPKVPRSRPKAIKGEDSIAHLLHVAATGRRNAKHPWPERDLALVVVLITCGLRLSELTSLTIGSFEGPNGKRVLGVRGKGRKERTVPVEPETEQILTRYLTSRVERFNEKLTPTAALFVDTKNQPMRPTSVQYLISQLYRDAGITNQVPKGALVHALRHTFATSVARNGASGTELQTLLGHESLATTQQYIDVTAREVRQAARNNDAYTAIRGLLPSVDAANLDTGTL